MNSKGELTTQQIVMIVILITSFVILLFFITQLDLGDTSKKDVCHNSVVLATKGKGLIGDLDCSTSYVCISGGGECEGFSSDYVVDIDLTGDAMKDKELISEAIAEEMADCWWMFGEGRIDKSGINLMNYECGICSQVRFDSEVQNSASLQGFSYKDLFDNFEKLEYKNSNYLNYLYGSSTVQGVISRFSVNQKDMQTFEQDYKLGFIDFKSSYNVISGFVKRPIGVNYKNIYSTFILSSETSSRSIYTICDGCVNVDGKCDEFITKA